MDLLMSTLSRLLQLVIVIPLTAQAGEPHRPTPQRFTLPALKAPVSLRIDPYGITHIFDEIAPLCERKKKKQKSGTDVIVTACSWD